MANYYVNSGADPGGDGTTTATSGANCAWDTVSDVNAASFSAGDTISFNKGNEWREKLIAPSSGSSGNHITFGAYGSGAAPIINGSDLVSTWTEATASTWTAAAQTGGGIDSAWSVSTITFRNVVEAATSSTSGSKVRCKFRAQSGNVAIDNAAIGVRDGSGPDTTSMTRITFNSGNNGITAASPVWSDWITFSFDETNDHISAFYIGGTTYNVPQWASGSGVDSYRKDNADEAQTADVTDGDYTSDDDIFGLEEIEVVLTNIWQATCTTEPHNVWFDGTRGNEQASLAAVDSARDWYWTGNVLYVYSTSDPDAAYTTPGIEAHARDCVAASSKSYITIENLKLTKGRQPIAIEYGTDFTIQNNTLTQGSNGFWIDSMNNLIIDSNTISYFYYESGYSDGGGIGLNVGDCANFQISNNTVSYCDGYGIGTVGTCTTGGDIYSNETHHCGQATASTEPHGIEVWGDNTSVYLNDVHDNGTTTGDWAINIAGDSNLIYRNKVYDNADYGIYIYGGSSNQTYYNLIYGNGSMGYTPADAASGNKFYNNVLYGNSGYGAGFIDTSNELVKNNIFAENTTYEIYVNANAVSGFTSNYNCVYHSAGGNFMYWNGTAYNWAGWLANSSQGVNSINSDPVFIDAANDKFSLQSTSPAIDAGVDVSLTTDYAGSTVPAPSGGSFDIGAFEYVNMTPAAQVVASSVPGATPSVEFMTGLTTGSSMGMGIGMGM